MRFSGPLGVLALLLVAGVLTVNAGAPVAPASGASPGPAGIFTIAQTTTVAGFQIALSLNCIEFDTASACEYSTATPGTRRMVADVTLSPAFPAGFFTSPRIFGLVDTGACRYSLRLPDAGTGGPVLPRPLLGDRQERSGSTGPSGLGYSLGLAGDGLWGRVVFDRTHDDSPAREG